LQTEKLVETKAALIINCIALCRCFMFLLFSVLLAMNIFLVTNVLYEILNHKKISFTIASRYYKEYIF